MQAISSLLPNLSDDFPVSAAQATSYQQNGHILLRNVASSAEIAAYRPVIEQAAARYTTETRPLAERDTYGKAFLQIMNLWEHDEAVRRFILARRFAKVAADLMGVKAVRLYHDQALFKEPGGGPTPWHQDQYYWPLDTDKTITMWMPLLDVSAAMGTITFASGSQTHGYLGKLSISDDSQNQFQEFIAARNLSLTASGAMAAGDASFHAGWMLHSAPGNTTATMRAAMTIIYFADGTRIAEPNSKHQAADLRRWLPNLQTGDVAASPLNPLIYSA